MAIQYGPRSLFLRNQGTSGQGTAGQPAQQPLPFSRSGHGAAPVPARAPAKQKRPVSQTTAQVANQRVNAQLNPQIAAQNSFNQQQNQAIQSFAQALLGKLQPIAGQVGASYDSAIQQQGALSGQAASFLQGQNPTGQVAQLLAQAGAPQQQQDQLAGQFGQTFGGGAGVLAFTGGAIPGGQMAADKAAMVGQAAQLPGQAALQGQQDLASALWQQNQSRQELLAQRPALLQQATQDIHTNQAARAKLAQDARQDLISNRFKAATIGERQHEFDIRTKQHGDEFNATAQQRADEFAATQASKKAATDFLNWYRTQGLTHDEAALEQKWNEFQVTSGQRQQGLTISQQNANVSQQNANTSATRANNAAKIAAYKAAHPTVTTRTIKVPGGTALVNSKTGAVIATYKAPKTAAAASGGKFSNSDVASLATDLSSWHSGITGTSNGEPVRDPDSQLSWNEAHERALTRLPNTKAGRAKALSLVNAEFGTPESIAFTAVKTQHAQGTGLTDSLKYTLQHAAAGDLPVPLPYALQATARSYGVKMSDVRTIISQLKQFYASNPDQSNG